MIGPFIRSYFTVLPAKIRLAFLTFIANKNLKHSFSLNCLSKRGNDLTTMSSWLVLFSTYVRNLKRFRVTWNRTCQTYSRNKNKSTGGKTCSVRNLQFGPQTWLLRGIYTWYWLTEIDRMKRGLVELFKDWTNLIKFIDQSSEFYLLKTIIGCKSPVD